MTTQKEVFGDPNYIPVFTHGFVGLIDIMGSDQAITDGARMSYGKGTKQISDDRSLIRYLFRHRHTSPIELCEVKFHIRLPIVVMRQLVRHRTASLNEYSGRYSEMSDEFYLPDDDVILPQSRDNKQGRSGTLSTTNKSVARRLLKQSNARAYAVYEALLNQGHNLPDRPDDVEEFDQEFDGISRELARICLPLSTYTEIVWKQNLHNIFHLLKLRLDPHAQYETRVFAEAMYELIKPKFPLAVEAFEDYSRQAKTLSRMEVVLMRDLLNDRGGELTVRVLNADNYDDFPGVEADLIEKYGLSRRELREFIKNFITTD